jgi:hypothetical protein
MQGFLGEEKLAKKGVVEMMSKNRLEKSSILSTPIMMSECFGFRV